jgi:hypothetical protein
MVQKVHCIVVPDVSKRLIRPPKVTVQLGDMRDPRLGLSSNDAEECVFYYPQLC